MTVFLAECVAIATLNLCTIIVFIKNRSLRKRRTYLVINLAVIDMLVGGIAVHNLFYWTGMLCNLWKLHSLEVGANNFIGVLITLFPFGSLTDITIIALERLHATFRPLKHRVLKKMGISINNCCCLGYIWVGINFYTSFSFQRNRLLRSLLILYIFSNLPCDYLFLTRPLLLKSVVERSLNTMVQPVEKEN